MKATLEHVTVESLAPFPLPEVDVKFTTAEWKLTRKFIRMAREHMETLETELQENERLVYKKMMPIMIDIDEKVTKSLEKIHSEHENVNMNAVEDFHRYDWTEELNQNVATEEEVAEMMKEEEAAEQAANTCGCAQSHVPCKCAASTPTDTPTDTQIVIEV